MRQTSSAGKRRLGGEAKLPSQCMMGTYRAHYDGDKNHGDGSNAGGTAWRMRVP
jgi:hypothetical protein